MANAPGCEAWYREIPGVVDVLRATPHNGCVTLVVDDTYAGWPDGYVSDGRGALPLGVTVHLRRTPVKAA